MQPKKKQKLLIKEPGTREPLQIITAYASHTPRLSAMLLPLCLVLQMGLSHQHLPKGLLGQGPPHYSPVAALPSAWITTQHSTLKLPV